MAEKIRVPVSTYREWEYERAILGEPYQKLAEVFEVSLSELITGTKPQFVKSIERVQGIQRELEELKRELTSLF